MDWNESVTLYPNIVMHAQKSKCMNYYLYSHRQLYSVMANLDAESLGFLSFEKK